MPWSPAALRSTQFAILAELNRHGKAPPTMAELAHALSPTARRSGTICGRWERDGYVTLEESDEDRRRRHVVMTSQGKVKFREARPLWARAQERFVTVFGESAAADLRATLLDIAYDERLAAFKD